MTDGFRFYKPSPLLRDYVRYYWVFKSDQPIETYRLPSDYIP